MELRVTQKVLSLAPKGVSCEGGLDSFTLKRGLILLCIDV